MGKQIRKHLLNNNRSITTIIASMEHALLLRPRVSRSTRLAVHNDNMGINNRNHYKIH